MRYITYSIVSFEVSSAGASYLALGLGMGILLAYSWVGGLKLAGIGMKIELLGTALPRFMGAAGACLCC